jgi:adenylate cyclase
MIYRFGDSVLDSERRELIVGGVPVHVEPQVFDVLRHLLENRDRVVSRDELIESVWRGRIVSEATISARIFSVRQAVGDTGEAQTVIRTVPRCGFRLVAPVIREAPTREDTVPSLQDRQVSVGATKVRKSWSNMVSASNRSLWSLAAVAASLLIALTGAWWIVPKQAELDRVPSVASTDRSIAVMPFDTFSGEQEQLFLAQGMAEDITIELSRNADLTVLARSAAFSLSEKGLSAWEVANEVGVQYILEGSVRRAGEELRISTQLIDAKTGNQVWADRYDAEASSLYEMQDDIVDNIVGTLLSEVRETEKRTILRRPPSNLDVYELSLRGLARKHRLNAKDLRLGREDLLHAVKLDPEHAPAWLYLGWIEAIAVAFGWFDDVTLGAAMAKIEKAIELDPSLPTAYQALGIVRAFVGDAQGSLQAAQRSVELGPGDADNLLFLGRALATNGEFDQAVRYGRRAMALNPSRPSYYAYHLGRALWGTGELKDSSRLMDECLTTAPGFTACRIFRIANHNGMGNSDQASKAVTALLEQSPDFSVEDALKSVGFPGDPNSNERLASQLIEAGLSSDEGFAAIKRRR